MFHLSYFNDAWTWTMRGCDLIDAELLVQLSANAMCFVNLIKAIDNNSLPWVINVVHSHWARDITHWVPLGCSVQNLITNRLGGRRDEFLNTERGSITFTGVMGQARFLRAAVYEDIKLNGTGTN